MVRPHTAVRPGSRLAPGLVFALAAVLAAPLPAWAAVQWHPDLATARAAARISQRPVLAVFTATWSPVSAALESTTFASAEAEALLAACFEPVRLDIEAHRELTSSLGVTHVPTACVLGGDDAVVARFELTASPAEFVAAAVRAAQTAADGRPADSGSASTLAPARAAGATQLTLGGAEPEAGSPVTEKVRRLSQFATAPTAAAMPVTPVARAPLPNVATAMLPQPIAEAVPQPTLPVLPPPWPAVAATVPPERVPAGPRPSIEPSTTVARAEPTTPWLDAPRPDPAASQAAAPAGPTDVPPVASPAPAAAPKPNAIIAALQKPFQFRNPFAAAAPSTPPPPTMPPARSRSAADDAPAIAAYPPAAAGQPEDPHGSMPLGLEGYCPVTLVERGVWTEGRAQWGARHRGRTYLFAGAQQQQAFLADPDRYAPALSGDDPVLALEGGRSAAGQRRYGVTYQARTYLFASPETRTKFAADPGRYAARVAMAEQPDRIARR